MKNSNNFINNCKHTNSQKIVERYSNIAVDFKELKEKLSADSNLFNISNGRARNKDGKFIDVVYAHFFNNNEELENITFYVNGGTSIGTKENHLSFKWRKHLNTEELQKRIESEISVDGFKPIYFGENVEMKVGHDVNFLGRDSNTLCMIQELVDKFHLENAKSFNDFGTLIFGRDWNSMKKTHKNEFSRHNLYRTLVFESVKGIRQLLIISEKYFLEHFKRYYSFLKICIAKNNNNNSQFKKWHKIFLEESHYLIPRIENPQIIKRGLWYKIEKEILEGNRIIKMPSQYSELIHSKFPKNSRMIPFIEYYNLKDVICSSKNNTLKTEFLKSYKNIFSMNLKEVHFLNNRFKKIIYTNEELIKVWNFKKIQKKVKREEKNKNIYLLNSFNSVFHSSNRLWIITTKSGKIRKFKNFETYLKAKPYFNKSNKEAV